MPIIHCSIDGCVGRKECSMHRFPDPRKNLDFFKKWIELCSNKNVVDMIPEKVYANRRVCNVHFKGCDYVSNKLLKRTAYPSLNMPEIITEGETASLIPTGNIELPLNHIFLQTPDVNKPSSTSFNSSTSNDIPSTPVKNIALLSLLLLPMILVKSSAYKDQRSNEQKMGKTHLKWEVPEPANLHYLRYTYIFHQYEISHVALDKISMAFYNRIPYTYIHQFIISTA
ncbi:hypothetical protein FQA39_LY14202 [Lamprigera yunnana]|nr:hypothetical protein FQA39_LY14202 [Lamprigera yunnana]